MSDSTKSYILPQERSVDPYELQQMMLDRRQSQIHTAMPAQIVSYDPAKMTVVVQPALQMTHFKRDGTREPVTIAHIHDVPVWFPSGGGHIRLFPSRLAMNVFWCFPNDPLTSGISTAVFKNHPI
jgi:hypothetical protein